MDNKICRTCKEAKEVTAFIRKKNSSTWIATECKKCTNKKSAKRDWRGHHPVEQKRIARTYRKKHPEIGLFDNAKSRAKLYGIPINITREDVVIPVFCPVLGIPLDKRTKDHTPSLDKILPEKGYVKGNIAVISLRANRIKSDATPEELEKISKWVKEKSILDAQAVIE